MHIQRWEKGLLPQVDIKMTKIKVKIRMSLAAEVRSMPKGRPQIPRDG